MSKKRQVRNSFTILMMYLYEADIGYVLRRMESRLFMTSSDQVINSRTAKYHFGDAFSEEFEDP